MSNRSAKFVSAIFASILAGTSFAAVAENDAKEDGAIEPSAKTENTCLSGPKGSVPPGGHWYYRIDHATKRNCWYIGEEKNKSARAAPKEQSSAPATSPVAANPVSPSPKSNARKAVADARAELMPQMRAEQSGGDNAGSRASAAAPVASIQNGQSEIAPDASSPVASRWPDSSGLSPSSGPRLAAAEPPPSLQSQSLQSQSLQTSTTPAPQPAATPVALVAVDSSLDKQSASMQMLLLTMAGALALAGITASLIFRFGRPRLVEPEIRGDRRAIWDSVHAERRSPSMFPADDMFPAEDLPIWRNHAPRNLPRDPRAPDDPQRRVTEMLARLARSAQT